MTPPIIPEQDMLVKRARRESLAMFPHTMRDGHTYHATAYLLDKLADHIEAQASLLNEKDAEIEALKHDRDLRGWGDAVDAHFDKGRTASLLNEAIARIEALLPENIGASISAEAKARVDARAFLATLKSHVGEKGIFDAVLDTVDPRMGDQP